MTDALKELLKDNTEMLAEVVGIESSLANATTTSTLIQEKLNTAIGTRDKAKNENTLFRSKFNVDSSQEINDEFLETIGAKKDVDVKKIEDNYMAKFQEQATVNDTQVNALNQKMKTMAMDMAIRQASEGQGVTDNPILAKAFREELHAGAVEKDGSIVYMGDNDLPVLVNGKPMTVSDKIANMKGDDTFDVFFGKTVSSGTGGSGGGSGNVKTSKSKMTRDEQTAYMKEHGAEKYHALED